MSNPIVINEDNKQEVSEDELDDSILSSLVKHAYETYSVLCF